MPADLAKQLVVVTDHARLLRRMRTLAEIGARPDGGVNRQAFTRGDIAARRLMLRWADAIGLAPFTDGVGNLFLRLSTDDVADRPAVLSGSHLDTQPAGGWLDGAYGVVAAVESLQAIKEAGVALDRPIDAVAWVNEEGCRYHPGLMGSSFFSGQLRLDSVAAQADADGVPLGRAIADFKAATPELRELSAPHAVAQVVEAHIEQGPILEAEGATIGAVQGVQGLYWVQVTVRGEAGHAGTAPLSQRRDAALAAVRIINGIAEALHDPDDRTRFTVGRILVSPNSPNTIADHVTFTIDLRHPDDAVLERSMDIIRTMCRTHAEPCAVEIEVTEHLRPVAFDRAMVEGVAAAAEAHGHVPHAIVSGGTHDAAVLAGRYPTGMIFIPCVRGISHHPDEDAAEEAMTAGADVLATVLARLASSAG